MSQRKPGLRIDATDDKDIEDGVASHTPEPSPKNDNMPRGDSTASSPEASGHNVAMLDSILVTQQSTRFTEEQKQYQQPQQQQQQQQQQEAVKTPHFPDIPRTHSRAALAEAEPNASDYKFPRKASKDKHRPLTQIPPSPDHAHDHDNDHDHDHDHGHDHGHAHGKPNGSAHAHEHKEKRHSHSHDHGHGHSHEAYDLHTPLNPKSGVAARQREAASRATRKLIFASVFYTLFMICEIVGGFLANSLALMSDAAHLLSDLAGFLISLFSLWIATRPATDRLSFGFHRAEILGALVSVLLIWVLSGVLVYESIGRISDPKEVNGMLMFIVASIGLAVNIAMACMLGDTHSHSHSGSSAHSHVENINVRAALIHVLGDAIQSVGVMIAAGLIWWDPKYHLADPICTLIFVVVVLATTIRLVKESVAVLMEGTPEGIDPAKVVESFQKIHGVQSVHDLHIWSLSVGKPALSVHLAVNEHADQVLKKCQAVCAEAYGIHHTTIQIETQRDALDCDTNFLCK